MADSGFGSLEAADSDTEARNQAEIWLAFKVLKPLCYELLSHQTKTTDQNELLESKLKVLKHEISQLPARGLQACTDYVALPLVALIRFYGLSVTSAPSEEIGAGIDKVIEALLETLSIFFHNVQSIDQELFLKVFQAILKLMDVQPQGDPNTVQIISNTTTYEPGSLFMVFSEEARKGIIETLDGIFEAYKPSDQKESLLGDPKMLPSLAFVVYRLLEVAVKDKNRINQVTCLKTLQKIVLKVTNLRMTSNLVPGILTSLTKIIMGDYKQGQDVFIETFKFLGMIIVQTMNDASNHFLAADNLNAQSALDKLKKLQKEHLEQTKTKKNDEKSPLEEEKPPKEEKTFNLPKRDETWFKNAGYHIHQVLSRLYSISRLTAEGKTQNASMSLIIFKSALVRLEMARTGVFIATQCRRTLHSTLGALFEVLVLFSFDDHQEVAQYCEKHLNFMAEAQNFKNSSSQLQLHQILAENLAKLVSSLPRIIREPDDNNKVLVLRLVAGYIRLLGPNLHSTLSTLLPKLAQTLLQILTFDVKDYRIHHKKANILLLEGPEIEISEKNQNPNISDLEEHVKNSWYQIQQTYRYSFLHFRDTRILNALLAIILQMGAFCDLDFLFDHFTSIIISQHHQSNETRQGEDEYTEMNGESQAAQIILILNELSLGASGFLDPSTMQRVKLPKRRQSSLKSQLEYLLDFYLSEEVWKNTSIFNSSHVYQMTLILEGIGNLSMLFGTQFNSLLMKALYPVLQVLGSASTILGQNSKLTLLRIAIHCGHSNIIEFINKNMDFIVDSVVHEMRYIHDLDGALNVLQGVLRVAKEVMIPLLDDLLDEIFKGLDERHEKYNMKFLTILHGVVDVVSKQPHKSRAVIRRQNHLKQEKPIINPHKRPAKDQVEESDKILEDYTIHNWIKRCEGVYYRKNIETFAKPQFMVKMHNSSANPPKEEEKSNRSLKEDDMLLKEEEMELETPLNEAPIFSLKSFLKSRIQRRIDEESLFTGSSDNSDDRKSAEDFFKEHHKQKEEDDAMGKDVHADESVAEEIESDEEYQERDGKLVKQPHRPGYDFVHRILEKLQHWMNIRSLEARVVVLDTIQKGIHVLSEHEKVLLPTIHIIWQPLQWRFLDTDYRIVNKALDIMQAMTVTGKAFVTRRFIDDLWPLLKQIITLYNVHTSTGEKHVANSNIVTQYSKFVDAKQTFQTGQSFKAQQGALTCIITALTHLKLPLPILYDIMHTCWFYLSELQPPVIQEAACQSYLLLARYDTHNVWLLMSELSHSDTVPPMAASTSLQQKLGISLPIIQPLVSVAPEKHRKNELSLTNFYAQFHKNATQLLSDLSKTL